MKIQKYSTWLALSLVAFFWVGNANAVSVTGIAVGGGGTSFTTEVEPTENGKIKYFIPLRDSNNGTYGVTPITQCGSWPDFDPGIAGTCSDKGYGSGYAGADALQMNIFFDLDGVADSADAQLDFVFDDLDLQRINDPYGFFESLTLSYWDSDEYIQLNDGSTIFRPGDMTTGDYAGASTVIAPSIDPLLWTLDLGTSGLGLLSLLNNDDDGFWIQLGFGSWYSGYKGKNTPEFLTAELTVSPVPVPSAVWLFGSALIGFIGMSRRTRV